VPAKPAVKAAPVAPDMFAGHQLLLWAIEGLSEVVAASITDDVYGTTQKRLSEILSSLVTLLETTEYFTKATISPNSGVAGLANHQTNAEHATALKLTLKSALYRITSAFHVHLNAVKLSDSHKARLQRFAAFAE